MKTWSRFALILAVFGLFSLQSAAFETTAKKKQRHAVWNEYIELTKKRNLLDKQLRLAKDVATVEKIEGQIAKLEIEADKIKPKFDLIEKEPVKMGNLWADYFRLIKKRAHLEKQQLTEKGKVSENLREELTRTITEIETVMKEMDKLPTLAH